MARSLPLPGPCKTLTFYSIHFCTINILIGHFVTKKDLIKITNCNPNYLSDSLFKHLANYLERVNTDNSRRLKCSNSWFGGGGGGRVRGKQHQKVRRGGKKRAGCSILTWANSMRVSGPTPICGTISGIRGCIWIHRHYHLSKNLGNFLVWLLGGCFSFTGKVKSQASANLVICGALWGDLWCIDFFFHRAVSCL